MTFTHRLFTAGLSTLSVLALSTTFATATAVASPTTTDTAPGVPPSLAATDPTIGAPADDPFYTPPASIPAAPGSLIRDQFAPHLLAGFDQEDAPARADKILYTSTAQDGSPVATSGFVMEPARPWTGEGPTPTIVFAPGTRGAGDYCAPSRAGNLFASTDMAAGSINVNYEYPFYAMASAAGYRVVVTDYIGLGTPGQHTYVNHTEEAHAVLDAARAGLAFAGAAADSPVALFGYSQGGGATAGAAELAASYAPELNVKGTFAGAPPASLDAVAGAIDNHMIEGVLGYALNGALARHPELASLQDEYFNDEGKRYMASTANECIGNSVANWAFRDTRTLTKDGRSFSEIIRDDERLRNVLLDSNYKLGSRALNAPMMVLNGRNDDTIPWGQARDTAADYCASDGTVKFVTDETPSVLPRSVINHAVPMISQVGTGFQYINDRFNDVPAPSNCGQF
ncbi:MAG TPA: lipase [Corynebacterium variabile]|nr:lipase [Corynebacterium variabile]